jgi:hypothetical protein
MSSNQRFMEKTKTSNADCLQRRVRMQPTAKQRVLAKLPHAYAFRFETGWCVYTGNGINLKIGSGDTRTDAWKNAAAS